MGISKKGLRKIVRSDRTFYWCVRYDYEDDDRLYLVIMSEDKNFLISYMLDQKNVGRMFSPKIPLIIVKGKEFKGLNNLGHFWERFVVPNWDDDIVTPSLVAQIIDWCFVEEDVISVDWKGNILNNRLDDRHTV